ALGRTRRREQAVTDIVQGLLVNALPGETQDQLAIDFGSFADGTHDIGTDTGDMVVTGEVVAAGGHVERRKILGKQHQWFCTRQVETTDQGQDGRESKKKHEDSVSKKLGKRSPPRTRRVKS